MPRRQNPEAAAAAVLEKHCINAPPVDVFALAQRYATVQLSTLDDNVSGLLVRDKADRCMIAINVKHHVNRQRFSVAHELGHLILHGSDPTLFVDDLMVHFRVKSKNSSAAPVLEPKEAEANQFAGALLMPEGMLMDDISANPIDMNDEARVVALARKYGVSQQALTIRLAQMGLLSGV